MLRLAAFRSYYIFDYSCKIGPQFGSNFTKTCAKIMTQKKLINRPKAWTFIQTDRRMKRRRYRQTHIQTDRLTLITI